MTINSIKIKIIAVILVDVGVLQNPCVTNYFPKFLNNGIQTNLWVNSI